MKSNSEVNGTFLHQIVKVDFLNYVTILEILWGRSKKIFKFFFTNSSRSTSMASIKIKFENAINIGILPRCWKFEDDWSIRKGVRSEKPAASSWKFTNFSNLPNAANIVYIIYKLFFYFWVLWVLRNVNIFWSTHPQITLKRKLTRDFSNLRNPLKNDNEENAAKCLQQLF